MGGASSTQRSGKATQSQTILRESTNANTPKDIAQAANIAKDNQNSLDVEGPKKDYVTPTEGTGDVVTAMLSKTNTDKTNHATNVPDKVASTLSSPVSSVPGVEFPESANAVSAPPTLEVIAPQHIKDAPTLTLVPDQGRKVLGQINVRDQKIGTRPEKRTRRGRGKRKDKVTTQDGTENVPPPATQQNTLSRRRRRTRGSGYVDIGTRPAPRRGRTASSVGGVETTNVVNYVASQVAETNIEDVKTTGRHAHVDRALDAGMRPKHRARGRLPSHGKKSGPGLEDLGIPNMVKDPDVNTADGLTSRENHRRSGATASSPRGETRLPEPTDGSTLQPLPSSTRRRAKEYFQRRTRERSVDARPPRRCVTTAELGSIRSSVQESQLDLKSGPIVNASGKSHGRRRRSHPSHFLLRLLCLPMATAKSFHLYYLTHPTEGPIWKQSGIPCLS
ncbi:hypothetical protein BJV77DRAFT_508499 [Russula vinacea]|nr:hypothetical protein BJV77DRAFT_508499 [Russula vinacea]